MVTSTGKVSLKGPLKTCLLHGKRVDCFEQFDSCNYSLVKHCAADLKVCFHSQVIENR